MTTLRIFCVGTLALCCCAMPAEAETQLVGQIIKSGAEVFEGNTSDSRFASRSASSCAEVKDACPEVLMDYHEDFWECQCRPSAWKITLWVIGTFLGIPLVCIALKWWCKSDDKL